jgi:hypothetical protein
VSPGKDPAALQFLIGGTARSGTTLVQRLCCELSSVWVPPETHFWMKAEDLTQEFRFPLRDADRLAAIRRVMGAFAVEGGEFDPEAVATEIGRRRRRVGLWTLFESVVAAMSPPDRRVLGEKTPAHTLWWEHLLGAVEGLKLIGVVRDPRAVLRSHRSVAWGEGDAYALAERWLAHQRALLDARRIFGAERVLLVRCEDVVADPGAAQAGFASFLGVPCERVDLSESLIGRFPLFNAHEVWKSRALEGIESRGEEASGVSEADRAVLASACGLVMGAFGYDAGDPGDPAPPRGESQESVRAFRRWNAAVAAATNLAVY